MTAMKAVWQVDPAAAAEGLNTDLTRGLSGAESVRRLAEQGPNQLQEQPGQGPWQIFLSQFQELIVWVLIGAAVVSGFLKEWVDAGAIVGIVIRNSLLGFFQEYRA